jgi:hypothetical protein
MVAHAVYVILERMLIQTLARWRSPARSRPPAAAQSPVYQRQKARRHFISLTYDWQFVQPYRSRSIRSSELLGQPVNEVHLQDFQYEPQDSRRRSRARLRQARERHRRDVTRSARASARRSRIAAASSRCPTFASRSRAGAAPATS